MKKSILLVIAFTISFAITLPAMAGPKVLKFATPYAVSNPMTTTSRWFGAELEKRTNGRYKVEYYYSGSMGKAPDLPSLCGNGVVDLILHATGYTPAVFKLSRGFELMYLTENPFAQGAAIWDLYNNYSPIREEWDKAGIVYGFSAIVDNMAVVSKSPITTIEDMKGKKFRGYAAVVKMINKLGGIPVALSYAEIYDALNRGMLEGAFGVPYGNVYGSRFWEVAPKVIDTGVGVYSLLYFAISKKTYDSFDPETRKIVDQLREEGNAEQRKWLKSYERDVTQKIVKEKFVELIAWSPEVKAKAKNMVVPYIWEDWLKEMEEANLPGQQFLDTYKAALKKCEAGYPYENPYIYYQSMK
jgi:TRAP-type C4-dicarboxylate transport system substrate-binding protein